MIKVYKASGYDLDKLMSEVPKEIEDNIINIKYEEIPSTYKEYEDLDAYEDWEECEEDILEYVTSNTYYKIKIFYHGNN